MTTISFGLGACTTVTVAVCLACGSSADGAAPVDEGDPVSDIVGTDDSPAADPTGSEHTPPEPEPVIDYTGHSFVGDDLQPEVPDPSEGFQLHYGPSDPDDPDDLFRFVLEPGDEVTDCQFSTAPNTEDILYDRYLVTMRPGTHHIIISATPSGPDDGELRSCFGGTGILGGRWMFGGQSGLGSDGGRIEYPPADGVAPENEGLAFRLEANLRIEYNAHYVNVGDEPLLRESWANVWYADETDATQIADPILFIGGMSMSVAPHSTAVVEAECAVPDYGPEQYRILDLAPHMHAHGKRFSVFRVDEGGNETRIYETYDWAEPLLISFNSVTENPEPDPALQRDGGVSGIVALGQGETIRWECEIENDLDRTLRFANEAYTAEMCNLFGHYTPSVGGSWRCLQ